MDHITACGFRRYMEPPTPRGPSVFCAFLVAVVGGFPTSWGPSFPVAASYVGTVDVSGAEFLSSTSRPLSVLRGPVWPGVGSSGVRCCISVVYILSIGFRKSVDSAHGEDILCAALPVLRCPNMR